MRRLPYDSTPTESDARAQTTDVSWGQEDTDMFNNESSINGLSGLERDDPSSSSTGRKLELFTTVDKWLISGTKRGYRSHAHIAIAGSSLPMCGTHNTSYSEATRPEDDDHAVCSKCLRVAISRGRIDERFATVIDDKQGPIKIDDSRSIATGASAAARLHSTEGSDD
jgi:hypothetical protein